MIGLGVLFLVDGIGFWPWILVLIGITSLPSTFGRGDFSSGLQTLAWMCGLALLFSQPGLFFPGILILIGASIVIGALFGPAQKKAKRGTDLDDDRADEYEFTSDDNA